MKERDFQAQLIKDIKKQNPGSIILKADANYIQGYPELLVLLPNWKWAALECKKTKDASRRPNQDTYIDILNSMGFASFVYPENKEEVLDAIRGIQ